MTKMLPDSIFDQYDIVMLTETLATKEWAASKAYTLNVLAQQGPKGRPKGGITCLLKPKLIPFRIAYSTDKVLLIKTRL